ncbi:MAG TPA: glycosyltransferase family 4 protein [Nodosilinea sp.]|nr:glycosyltransferase family 4 protein [Nodosilinea sp.]
MTDPASLRCLFLHNYYQQAGGEDLSMAAEIEILRQAHHTVELLAWHNDAIADLAGAEKLSLFWQTTWNSASKRRVYDALQRFNADLLHVQNFFPLASPAVYSAARQLGVPVVQHLRNFRLGCLNGYLYRQGRVCEACVGRNPWRGVAYRCYRGSLPASLSLWQMLTAHRWRRTWHREVDVFITPSRFAAAKLIEIGLPAEKMQVKPNFVADPLAGNSPPPPPDRPIFTFVGRLSPEKGALELLQAWQQVRQPDWQLWIVGDGPEKATLERFCQEHHLGNVRFWGHCSPPQTLELLQRSTLLVLPCRWYETFGRVVIEAFACGRPALVSNIGAVAELVSDGETGFQVPYTDTAAWVERLTWCGQNLATLARFGTRARQTYLQHYTPAINYQRLREIYQQVLR